MNWKLMYLFERLCVAVTVLTEPEAEKDKVWIDFIMKLYYVSVFLSQKAYLNITVKKIKKKKKKEKNPDLSKKSVLAVSLIKLLSFY